jgi:hypothetical protein
MLMAVQTASLLNQPFSKCRTFHGSAPTDWLRRLARSDNAITARYRNSWSVLIIVFRSVCDHARNCSDFVDLHQHRNTQAMVAYLQT